MLFHFQRSHLPVFPLKVGLPPFDDMMDGRMESGWENLRLRRKHPYLPFLVEDFLRFWK